jgi:hypothetical protein
VTRFPHSCVPGSRRGGKAEDVIMSRPTFPSPNEFRAAAALCTADEWQEYFDSWIEVAEARGYRKAVDATISALDSQAVVDVLVEHRRKDITGCACGWSQLGHSHPKHVLGEIVVVVRSLAESLTSPKGDEPA